MKDQFRRFIIKKLDGVPREDSITTTNKYTIEHVSYPIIKLAREYECQDNEEMISYVEEKLASEFVNSLLKNNLLQIQHHRGYEDNVVVGAALEVVDKRDKSI